MTGKKWTQAGLAVLVLGNSHMPLLAVAFWGVLAVLTLACAIAGVVLIVVVRRSRSWHPGDPVPDVPDRLPPPRSWFPPPDASPHNTNGALGWMRGQVK